MLSDPNDLDWVCFIAQNHDMSVRCSLSLCLQVNRFEQFNINYANEKLQEYFNKHIFSLEQLEYNRYRYEWDIKIEVDLEEYKKRKQKRTVGVYSVIFLLFLASMFGFTLHREGVQWEAIDWMDNAECLDLIEKVRNIFSVTCNMNIMKMVVSLVKTSLDASFRCFFLEI